MQGCVSMVISEGRGLGEGRLATGDAEELAQPRGVAPRGRQVQGRTTPRVAQQHGGLLLQQTLNTLLLATQ